MLREALVVVDVAGAHDDVRAQFRSDACEVVSQCDFVGARIVADIDSGLHVSYRRVMEADEDELDALGKVLQLGTEPSLLIAAGQQRSVAIE